MRLSRSTLLLLTAAAAFLAAPPSALAQYGPSGSAGGTAPSEQEKKERSWGRNRDRRGGQLSQRALRNQQRLAEAYEHLYAERYDGAEAVLLKFRLRSLSAEERTQLFRVWAFVEYGRGNLKAARDYLEKTLAEDTLPPDEQAAIVYQIAQIYLSEEEWAKVVKSLGKWFALVEQPNSSAYYLLAIAHYQLGDLDTALEPAQKAVFISNEPQEGWLQLVLAILLSRKDYQQAVPVIEELVTRFPKKAYWLNLSTVQGVLGNYEESLIPLQLAHTQGLLTSDPELLRLAQLLLFLDLPYRSAQVMKAGLDQKLIENVPSAWEMLSSSWIAAREFDQAVVPLQRAADLSEGGDLYVRLAQVHIQRENWEEAADALRQAIEKGGLEKPGDAKLLMGIAYYSQKRPERARSWFARARKHEGTRQEAATWIRHIDQELEAASG